MSFKLVGVFRGRSEDKRNAVVGNKPFAARLPLRGSHGLDVGQKKLLGGHFGGLLALNVGLSDARSALDAREASPGSQSESRQDEDKQGARQSHLAVSGVMPRL